MNSDPFVLVDGVTKRFGRNTRAVLDGVDLRVDRGEMLAIEGPSGSGKSTLLHLIAALDKPDSGRITVAGRDLAHRHDLNRYRRREIGIVFQLHNLIPRLSALENIEIAMFGTGRSRRERRSRALLLAELVGLAPVVRREPSRLSGGERQRVAIARALANHPALVLADEPTGSLDQASADRVLQLLARLRDEEQLTVIAVTHDERLAAIATRRVLLDGGKLVPAAGPQGIRQ